MSRSERVNPQTLASPRSGSQSFQEMDTTFHYQPFYPQYTSSYPLSMVAPPSVYGGGTSGGGTSSSSSSSFHLEGATEQHPNLRDDRRKNRRRGGGVKLSTDPQSVAARERRHRISDRFKILQSLVPGGSKMDTVSMLEEAIHYVKFLKTQIWLHQALMSPSDDHGDAPALPQPQAPPPLPFAPETLLPSNPPVGTIIPPSVLPQQQQSFAPSAPFTSQPCWDDHPMEEHDDQMFPLPSSIYNYYN